MTGQITNQAASAEGIKYEYYEDDTLLGRATLYLMYNDLHDEPFGFLEDVYVEDTARGKGIGTKLTLHIIKQAKELNCYKLICTSRYSKPRVHALYERLGFKDHGKEFRIDF
jgi:GNAT superfamily N-acetyltransferase